MTTHRADLATDGVPAPSKFDPVHRTRGLTLIDFNGATKRLGICRDRERFHRWCGKFVNLSVTYYESTWRILYKVFVQYETDLDRAQKDADARDLDDTQQDARW